MPADDLRTFTLGCGAQLVVERMPGMLRLWAPIWQMRPSLRAHWVRTRPSSTV